MALPAGKLIQDTERSFMDEKLWAGPELKLQYAAFHLDEMGRAIQPPEPDAHTINTQLSGGIIGARWQLSFYAYLDALLSVTRSIPEIIQCCFGADQNSKMKAWFDNLSAGEQQRRKQFRKEFNGKYEGFRALPLGNARHISEHRTGYAPVTVTISGRFGLTYRGGPAEPVPGSETRPIDIPELALLAKPHPVEPRWDGFEIDRQPLFPACYEYLKAAQALVNDARVIATRVHGVNPVSLPPT
jgi:hypothetical protein